MLTAYLITKAIVCTLLYIPRVCFHYNMRIGDFQYACKQYIVSTPTRMLSIYTPLSYTLTFIIHRQLTHGTFDRTTQSGRKAETWRGGVEEVRKKLDALTTNMVYRGGKAATWVWYMVCILSVFMRYTI